MPVTGFTSLLAIRQPIMLAPMDIVAGGRLTKALSDAGGFGVLGGGYGKDEAWLRRELDTASDVARIGVGFITWGVAQNTPQPRHHTRAPPQGVDAIVWRSCAAC
jgi:nitronate monooxygenase